MSILVTFADGHSTLVVDRAAADQIVAYWPQLHATVRDLDQEALDREEMIQLLIETPGPEVICKTPHGPRDCWRCNVDILLRRLGRLP